MPSIKDIKKRIGTVKNTQQTTRAMKMVSAAKLRRAQEAITNNRPYARQIGDLIKTAAAAAGDDVDYPLLGRDSVEGQGKLLLVLVTSDRGLCGGFNSSVIKAAQRWLEANRGKYGSVRMAFVGRRGYDFFKSRKVNIAQNYSELGGKVTFAKAKKLSDALIKMYLDGEVDEVKFIYNEFKNAVTQKPVVQNYLPLERPATEPSAGNATTGADFGNYLVRPGIRELLGNLLERHFPTAAYRVLLESQAGEHGARMSSMENATKNAGEMIKKLTLQYNKQRQAGITKELLEIISGSESQKSS